MCLETCHMTAVKCLKGVLLLLARLTSCSGRFSAISFSSTSSPRSRFSRLIFWMRSLLTFPALISTLLSARRPKS